VRALSPPTPYLTRMRSPREEDIASHQLAIIRACCTRIFDRDVSEITGSRVRSTRAD